MIKDGKQNNIFKKLIPFLLVCAKIISLWIFSYINFLNDSKESNNWNNKVTNENKNIINDCNELALALYFKNVSKNYTFDQLISLENFIDSGGYITNYHSINGIGNYTVISIVPLKRIILTFVLIIAL